MADRVFKKVTHKDAFRHTLAEFGSTVNLYVSLWKNAKGQQIVQEAKVEFHCWTCIDSSLTGPTGRSLTRATRTHASIFIKSLSLV